MSSCCAGPSSVANAPILCPVSNAKGSPVDLQTVKALLTERALRRITEAAHRLCTDPACDVVYFADDGQIYATADIRVKVWQKEPPGARVVCYCFGENEADIRTEIQATGTSGAVDRIRADIAAGRCACEVRNPRGACCLGDVIAAVRRVDTSLRPAAEVGA